MHLREPKRLLGERGNVRLTHDSPDYMGAKQPQGHRNVVFVRAGSGGLHAYQPTARSRELFNIFSNDSIIYRKIFPPSLVRGSVATLFGTLGFHHEKFLAAIPAAAERIERVLVYTGRESKARERKMSQAALAKVKYVLESMDVPYEHREFASPWDFVDILRTLMVALQKERREDTVFNLTGGPKTMTVAATVACLIHGVRVLYVPEELGGGAAPIELPLLRIRDSQVLTGSQQRVLQVIQDHSPKSLAELAGILDLSSATVTFHVQHLEELGAMTSLVDLKNRVLRTPRVTAAGEIMLIAERILARAEPGEG
jgi:CRISPR locus-related DNA-binding protein